MCYFNAFICKRNKNKKKQGGDFPLIKEKRRKLNVNRELKMMMNYYFVILNLSTLLIYFTIF